MGGVSGGAGKGAEGGRDKSKLRAGRFGGKMRTPGAQYREIGLQRGSHSGGGSRVGFEGPGRGMRGKVSLGVSTGLFHRSEGAQREWSFDFRTHSNFSRRPAGVLRCCAARPIRA